MPPPGTNQVSIQVPIQGSIESLPMECAGIASVSRHLHFQVACCVGLQGNGLARVGKRSERLRVPIFELDPGGEGVDLVRARCEAAERKHPARRWAKRNGR